MTVGGAFVYVRGKGDALTMNNNGGVI